MNKEMSKKHSRLATSIAIVLASIGAAVLLSVGLSSCYVPPTASPLPTPPMSVLPVPVPGPDAYVEVFEVQALDTVTREIGLFWDAPDTEQGDGWAWIGMTGYETSNHTTIVSDTVEYYTLITVTVEASSGEVFTFTGVNTLDIPKLDYALDCNYRLYQDGALIQSGHIANTMQPYVMPIQRDVHPGDVVPGTGQWDGTITYAVTPNFDGLAQLYESCKWYDKGGVYPEYYVAPPGQELEDGYYFAGLVGSPDLYVVYMPMMSSSKVEEDGDDSH